MKTTERAARAATHNLFGRIEAGRIDVTESFPGGESLTWGPDDAARRVAVEIVDPNAYVMLIKGRSVGLGESYAEGLWKTDQIAELFRIAALEVPRMDKIRKRFNVVLKPIQRIGGLSMINTKRGAKSNIAAHYDLGNELFETFLDYETMMYSSAVYADPAQSLEAAQLNRLERICDQLELDPSDHLLEIGTGWGGLAAYAAKTRGCRVTTTTISHEQAAYARERVERDGLSELVTVLEDDYRDLTGTYSKLVSIEMIEAVGWQYFDVFFETCSGLLEEDGLMFLQSICMDDRAYETEKASKSFANQLIFPGGCLPAPGVIADCVNRKTDLRQAWMEDISTSYALTLAEWRRRFDNQADQLEELGYDERFRRLWEMYFAFSEGGFAEGRITVIQQLFGKPGWRGCERLGASELDADHPVLAEEPNRGARIRG